NPKIAMKEAVLGDLDGGQLGLWVEQTGPQTAYFDWTARGDPRPSGLHFELQVPACAVASLELRVPAGQVVSAIDDGCLVSGPQPAEKPELQLWRLDFAGRSQVFFVVRRSVEAKDQIQNLVLADGEARHTLKPELVWSDLEFLLLSLRQPIR